MKQIKFRVWSKIFGRFLSKEEYCFDFDGKLIWVDIVNPKQQIVQLDVVPEQNYIVQQFTGLRDKNGREIYEGDIIVNHISYDESFGGQSENPIGVVQWISAKDRRDYSGWYSFPADLPWGEDDNAVEIIGNIYENPELLQQ